MKTKNPAMGICAHDVAHDDDGELFVRASAVLKSQGREDWPVEDPAPSGRVEIRALSGVRGHAEKSVGKRPWGGVIMWRRSNRV